MVRVPIGIQLVSPWQNAFVHVYVHPGARNASNMRRRNTQHVHAYIHRSLFDTAEASARFNGGGRYASRRDATRRARTRRYRYTNTVDRIFYRPRNGIRWILVERLDGRISSCTSQLSLLREPVFFFQPFPDFYRGIRVISMYAAGHTY